KTNSFSVETIFAEKLAEENHLKTPKKQGKRLLFSTTTKGKSATLIESMYLLITLLPPPFDRTVFNWHANQRRTNSFSNGIGHGQVPKKMLFCSYFTFQSRWRICDDIAQGRHGCHYRHKVIDRVSSLNEARELI